MRLYPWLTGRQLVELSLETRGIRDRKRLAEYQERLGAVLDLSIGQCSKGMRQRIALVAALAHDPELLVLYEPTSGLDPLMQANVLDLLREEQRRGRTISRPWRT